MSQIWCRFNVFLLFYITEKYPEIKQLFGYDPNFKWIVTGMVLVQIFMMYVMIGQSWPMIFLVAYCFGGIINHSLMLGEFSLSVIP
jgi:sphingolipid delta-4 desaturase